MKKVITLIAMFSLAPFTWADDNTTTTLGDINDFRIKQNVTKRKRIKRGIRNKEAKMSTLGREVKILKNELKKIDGGNVFADRLTSHTMGVFDQSTTNTLYLDDGTSISLRG